MNFFFFLGLTELQLATDLYCFMITSLISYRGLGGGCWWETPKDSVIPLSQSFFERKK